MKHKNLARFGLLFAAALAMGSWGASLTFTQAAAATVLTGQGTNPLHEFGTAVGISGSNKFVEGDFDGDGDTDLAARNGSSTGVQYWRNSGDGTFTELTGASNPFASVNFPAAVSSFSELYLLKGDFDRDGDLDLFNSNQDGQPVLYRNDGGSFTVLQGAGINPLHAFGTALGGGSFKAVAADLDGDGDTDLVNRNTTSTGLQYWRNNGNGTFTELTGASHPFAAVTFASNLNHFTAPLIAAGDFDGDGDVDVFNSNHSGAPALYRNDRGSFQVLSGEGINPLHAFGLAVGTGTSKFVTGDFDGDGLIDFANRNASNTGVQYWKQNSGGTYTELTGTANPFSGVSFPANVNYFSAPFLGVGDFDGDGDTDIVNVNHGGAPALYQQSGSPPRLTGSVPANHSTFFSPEDPVSLTFHQIIASGGPGVIEIRRSSDDTLVESISGQSPAITGFGTNVLTIPHTAALKSRASYYILIMPRAFYNGGGQSYMGITDKNQLQFTTRSSVQLYPVRPGVESSTAYTLQVNGEYVFVEKFGDVSLARFAFEGVAQVEVTASEAVASYGIRPQSYQIQGSPSGNRLSFQVDQPRSLIITVNGLEKLLLFADGPEVGAPNLQAPNVTSLAAYLPAGRNPEDPVTSYFQQAIDAVSASNNGAGGVLYVPDGKYMTAQLKLKSNVHLYLQSGAWIKAVPDSSAANYPVQNGSDSSFLFIQNAEHVRMSGRGIIDGNGMAMKTLNGSENIKLLRTAALTDLQIQDVYFLDSARWTLHLLYADQVLLKNIKIINDLRGGPDPSNPSLLLPTVTNTDGIDIDASQQVTIDGAFIYTGDDSISPKVTNYLGLKRPVTGVLLTNNVLWSLKAAFKIGDETLDDIGDIRFENNEVVRADRFAALWAGEGFRIHHIDIVNNRAEYIGGNYNERFFYFRIRLRDGSSSPGWIDQVKVKDFYAHGKAVQASTLEGFDATHQITNVTFDNIVIQGSQAAQPSDIPLNFRNTFYSNVVFLPSGMVFSGTQDPPAQLFPGTVEAEDMTLDGYTVEAQTPASGGKVIKVSGTGTASAIFDGEDGTYDIRVHYFDENDGLASYRLFINGNVFDAWTANQDFGSASVSDKSRTSRLAAAIPLKTGDLVKLEGTSNASEAARVDKVEITLNTGTSTPEPRVLLVDQRGLTSGAYLSIAAAVASTPALKPGDTISLVPGSGPYHETVKLHASGAAGNPIIFEGNGELISGFSPFQFTQEPSGQWTYTLPAPIANSLPDGKSNTFRHLVAYNGQRLLLDQVYGQNAGVFTSDYATLSPDGSKLILNESQASPTTGWEISTLENGVAIVTPDSYQTYRNLRITGVQNDGFNIHGTGTGLLFENIEAFNNFDEGFSSHDSTSTTINGGSFWGNDNGIYNQSRATISFTATNVKSYNNMSYGLAAQMGTTSLTNVQVWDNGISNLRLGGSVYMSNVTTYESRWTQRPWVSYQEAQNYKYNQEVKPYAYSEYAKADYPIVKTGTLPVVLPASQLPPFQGTYDDWRHIYFTPAQQSDASVSGPSADPDGDGLNNEYEYELGLHPREIDQGYNAASGTRLQGTPTISTGQTLDVLYSLRNVTSSVYGGQIAIEYSSAQLQYIGVTPMISSSTVTGSTYGNNRILINYTGVNAVTGTAGLFTLHFQPKVPWPTPISSVVVVSAVVTDRNGNTTELQTGPAYRVKRITSPNE
ncbi:hypothetical protein PAESOLCIP111_01214 [Paenibacillus solanacearum]|uniref:Cohesin domain-containing protein n=1 Tax=Paenibacillus solanacearum TaxID=2048548 RepID=A0A916JZN2_9BACL|nr:FG-GAP-like repeat-containing protein [Paenibacillus solanacearum]CAG7609864.1 hypothetical protein PAESOLCIP111_01214 [Paenibacillus solanacearum]